MAFLRHGGCQLHYKIEGKPGHPWLILGNSLGTDLHMWQPQVEPLLEQFRLLRWDMRGHGASDVPAGDYTMAELAADVLALAHHGGAERFAYCGLSLGAMVGQQLALYAPQRLSGLVLASAAAHIPSHESWSARMTLARDKGMAALLETVMPRFFSQPYRDLDEPIYHSVRQTFVDTDAGGYAGCCAAIRDTDFRTQLHAIGAPTLVIAGLLDSATPAEPFARQLVECIPGAQETRLAAGHIANMEQPGAFNRAVLGFLLDLPLKELKA
jgi:3-oxoadipate enol-lactonase